MDKTAADDGKPWVRATADLAAAVTFPILVSYGENDDAWPPEVQDLMAKRLGAERV